MADSFVQLNNDGPGKKIDTRTESTNGDHRQVMVIGDPSANANVANVTAAGGVQVDGSGVTQPVSAASLPLPAGAATAANQSTASTTLSSILTNTPPTGQASMAASSPVVIASNQSAVPVSGAITAIQGAPNSLVNGWPVELSDGTNLLGTAAHPVRIDPTGTTTQPVSGTITTAPPANASTNLTQVAGSAIALGQAAMAASVPVVIASNQVAVEVELFDSSKNGLTSQANGAQRALDVGIDVAGVQVDPRSIRALTSADTVTTAPPANASTNVAQFGGVTISTGTGASGTGIPRVTVSNDSNVLATQSGTWTVQPGNTPNTTPWLTTISQGGNSAVVNATNELLVTDTDLTLAQASPTSGQLGPLIQGAVTTAAPTYITAQTNPLSLTTSGALRTDASATTQPVSGTVTANQGTANATPWNVNEAQIAGTATSTAAAGVQKVGISGATAATLDAVITAATAPPNGLAILGVYNSTAPSLTTGQSVASQMDYSGSIFVKPHRRSETVSQATTIAASTTATTVLAAQAAGLFADITSLVITPVGAATATVFTCSLSDGTKTYIFDVNTGTTAGSAGMPVNVTFNTPLPATTAATAWTVANSSATPTVHITVVAVLQKAS